MIHAQLIDVSIIQVNGVLTVGERVQTEDVWIDETCATDEYTVVTDNDATAVEGCSESRYDGVTQCEVHVMLHPTYETPCPYFRIYCCPVGVTGSGCGCGRCEMLDPDTVCALLGYGGVGGIGQGDCSLVQEEHPVLGSPYYSFHVCGLQAVLEAGNGSTGSCGTALDNGLLSNPDSLGKTCATSDSLTVLMNLLSFIGPHLGTELLSTEQYKAVRDYLH